MDNASAGRLQLRCLGPFELILDGVPLELPGARPRTLLAALALHAGETVAPDRLATMLWGDDEQPADPRASIYTLVSRLRGRLGPELLRTRPDGYQLAVADADVIQFDRLAQEGRLEEALALWRGTPFAGLTGTWLERFETPRLVERYLDTVERLTDRSPDAAQLPRLLELATAHPLRESLWQRLIVVLDACGRPAEALDRYDEIRRRIADELGVDTSPELQAVYQRLLARTSGSTQPVPRQLPSPGVRPVGRELELKALDELAGRDDRRIAVVMGTAGVGKTTLAIHWAHQNAERFPDGQLYVNLRGFEPVAAPVSAEDALHSFLTALNVPANTIPSDLDGKAALFRSFVAGRRLLVLLDNAHDAEQVRPLLPGTASCLVVITTRIQLDGVIAAGAEPIILDLLPTDAALRLLSSRLGAEKVSADSTAAAELVRLCAGLPLALALVATRVALQRDFDLTAIAGELRTSRLDSLSGDDSYTDLRAVFSWSYADLSSPAAQMFRLIGRHPGPTFTTAAARAALGSAPTAVLRELRRAHLIDEPQPGVFTLHDLLRSYAQDLPSDQAAEHRIREYYLRTAPTADLAWFDAERLALLAFAATEPAAFLPVLSDYLDRSGHWHDWISVAELALRAADSPAAEVKPHLDLALADIRLERFSTAAEHASRSLTAARQTGDAAAEARALRVLGYAVSSLGRYDEALALVQESLALYAALGDELQSAVTLNSVGWELAQLGELADAETACVESLHRLRALDDPPSLAATYDSVAHLAVLRGRYDEAISNYRAAADIYQALADRYNEAVARTRLGDSLAAAEQDPQPEYAIALALFTGLHHPQAEAVRSRVG
ncbi:tetratricopeptide repeat protein [Kribbella sp. NBC_01505]|uniref:AfsR/SARP family transcriptional regulator n=1 Tax=Kribbella sp. NBC_01505 TaxID=2903580 RepID=UPI00386D6EA3